MFKGVSCVNADVPDRMLLCGVWEWSGMVMWQKTIRMLNVPHKNRLHTKC